MPDGTGSPEGVFGNLPSSRPGSRSPRRKSARESEDVASEPVEALEPEPAPPAKPERPPSPQTVPPDPLAEPGEPAPGIHRVEDLAWAGVAVAAQTATAGVRFASRALEAARKSIDRP